jgi:hypothetical protein
MGEALNGSLNVDDDLLERVMKANKIRNKTKAIGPTRTARSFNAHPDRS